MPGAKFQQLTIVKSKVLGAAALAVGLADLLIVLPDLVAGTDAVTGAADRDLAVAAYGAVRLAGAIWMPLCSMSVLSQSGGGGGGHEGNAFIPLGTVVDVIVDGIVAVANDWEELVSQMH